MQRLKEGGMQGYYFIVGPPSIPSLAFVWLFYLYDKPNGTVEALMAPIEERLKKQANLFAYTSNITHTETYWESYSTVFSNELVATGGSAFGSRLLSPESLSNPNITAQVFAEIGPSTIPGKPNVSLTFLYHGRYRTCMKLTKSKGSLPQPKSPRPYDRFPQRTILLPYCHLYEPRLAQYPRALYSRGSLAR